MMDRYAVLGNPVSHSKSPQIHAAFARQTGEEIAYEAIYVPTDEFAAGASDFIEGGGRGFNVTLPFKQEAWQWVGRSSARAQAAGAVNTVSVDQDSATTGDNTDGSGLIADITHNQQWPIEGSEILVVGAGGAVRGVLQSILSARPGRLVITNRTFDKAEKLADDFKFMGDISALPVSALHDPFDLIINGTSASLQGDVPNLDGSIIKSSSRCYDMMYAAHATPFNRWAASLGANSTSDGLGMLVEQAALAFEIWRGTLPQTRPVIDLVRSQLQKEQ
jgi:shikimate dehydrogenase|tara:strand:- start:3294 stop:4124 length:831 start_codon:yes stop_codon:yes gene_type:complete